MNIAFLEGQEYEVATRPQLTPEEQAFFDAEHDLSCALRNAATAATKALGSEETEDLAEAIFAFEFAHATAFKYDSAKSAMDKAFKLTDEYKAQVAAEEETE